MKRFLAFLAFIALPLSASAQLVVKAGTDGVVFSPQPLKMTSAELTTPVFTGAITGSYTLGGTPALGGNTTTAFTFIQTSAAAAAFASGLAGNTNPVFRLVNNVASQATGISITGRAAGAGADITTLSSGTNEPLTIEAKGSGAIRLNLAGTGAVLVGDATNPAFTVVHTTEGTGISVTSAAAAGGVAVAAISSGTDENLTIDAKGTGTVTINGTATGIVILPAGTTIGGSAVAALGTVTSTSANAIAVGPAGTTNPTFQVDASTGSAATGLKVKSAAAASGLAVSVISSGADENLTIDAKGTGTITLNGTATGNIALSRAATAVSLAASGAITSSSPSAKIGYTTGAGAAATQITSKSTTVANGADAPSVSGTITMDAAELAADAIVSFTFTNSAIAATDVVILNHISGGTVGAYTLNAQAGAGSAVINVANRSAGALSEAVVIQYAVIKAVAN